jgi:hypothetical protein
VKLEASDHPPANPAANPAAAGPPASPVAATVAVVPQQSGTLQPLAAVAIPAVAAKSEHQFPVEAKRQQPTQPAISALQAPAAPVLGRLEASTRLLADFSQGEVIESGKIDSVETPGELGHFPEAPIETIQAP